MLSPLNAAAFVLLSLALVAGYRLCKAIYK
jgi:hypothetical protein